MTEAQKLKRRREVSARKSQGKARSSFEKRPVGRHHRWSEHGRALSGSSRLLSSQRPPVLYRESSFQGLKPGISSTTASYLPTPRRSFFSGASTRFQSSITSAFTEARPAWMSPMLLVSVQSAPRATLLKISPCRTGDGYNHGMSTTGRPRYLRHHGVTTN